MKDKLKQLLLAFEKEILRANSCNQCYFDMRYRNGNWDNVYKLAPAFFGLARKSLQTEAFLTISKLYEEGNRSDYNLAKLLQFIESNSKRICGEKHLELNIEVKKYKEKLKEMQIIADRLLHIRDKIITHNDKEYFTILENKASDISISFEEVKDLLEFAEELVNRFNHIVSRNVCHDLQ